MLLIDIQPIVVIIYIIDILLVTFIIMDRFGLNIFNFRIDDLFYYDTLVSNVWCGSIIAHL